MKILWTLAKSWKSAIDYHHLFWDQNSSGYLERAYCRLVNIFYIYFRRSAQTTGKFGFQSTILTIGLSSVFFSWSLDNPEGAYSYSTPILINLSDFMKPESLTFPPLFLLSVRPQVKHFLDRCWDLIPKASKNSKYFVPALQVFCNNDKRRMTQTSWFSTWSTIFYSRFCDWSCFDASLRSWSSTSMTLIYEIDAELSLQIWKNGETSNGKIIANAIWSILMNTVFRGHKDV